MRVTTKHVMALCEEVNKLKRLGDMLADGKEHNADWRKETVASCELANSLMNNMTSVEHDVMDVRTQIALRLLPEEIASARTKVTHEDAYLVAINNCVALADGLLAKLDEVEGDRITSEDSRKYWQGRNSELKKSLAELKAELEQAKDDEAWALGCIMYVSNLNNVWHTTYVHPTTREETRAEGPTIHAALRALRAKVEGNS